jgi:putative CocE/NonD family hydrolase
MRARDGVVLRSDVYRPQGDGPFPVLLRRTPYGNRLNDLAEEFNEAHYFASHGYLVVVQDTRGRFSSEGEFYPFRDEGDDGYDAVEWAAQLNGSAGAVGTFGQSYGCLVQYLTAARRPPHLRVCAPLSGPMLSFSSNAAWYTNGLFELSWTLSYLINMAEEDMRRRGLDERIGELDALKIDPAIRFSPLTEDTLRHLPISDWIERLGEFVPFLGDIFYHRVDGPYWWYHDLSRQFENIDVPMLHIGSWYDLATGDTLALYRGVQDRGLSDRTRRNQALFMGPWAHLLPYNQPTSGGTGDIDFGPEAEVFLLDMVKVWFDHYLKGAGEGLPLSPVRLFVMGENRWRDEREWPLARAVNTPYYLHGDGHAVTAGGDGSLTTVAPESEPPDRYRYDPDDPVPTRGGHFVGGGVQDQRPNLERADVLVYTSPVLQEDLEITGPVTATLFVATSGTDTDFVVVVSDVRPDGYTQNLVEGAVRGRFRASYANPTPLEPGQVYELAVDLWATSHLLRAGHRIRVHVTSSDFPRFDRNLNTGESFEGTRVVVADQTLYHDALRPSHIVLPVVPR